MQLKLSLDKTDFVKMTPSTDFILVSDMNLDYVLSFTAPLFVTIMVKNTLDTYNFKYSDYDMQLYNWLIAT